MRRESSSDFFALHVPGDPFVLPNAWDVASALTLAAAGFPAIGTTSLGVAASAGVPDEHALTRQRNLDLLSTLSTFADAPMLTCDMENGYSQDPAAVVDAVDELLDSASAVRGINIEDSSHGSVTDAGTHAAKINAVKDRHPDLFVNARTDVFWTGLDDLAEALDRVDRYAEAGADGIFVPGDLDHETIARITEHTSLPVNVLATPRMTRAELADVGVARISTGSLLYRTALTAAVDTARGFADPSSTPRSTYSYSEIRDTVTENTRIGRR
ncbi:2-methylisocitrate lyase-like PEP mutase family enzyme [Brevibacterium sanguinis]|uniref:2-methylisocitrate lyase-like PEP mutase family enzyme n=2 Tax=Brevibacterium TaxID=1696 RepID=A0A366IMS1_9MICO|nr:MULTISPECIES: isocitrate lyase/phosphoenolpyruvate mutase family protein [Brevibacterium]RBP67277.1 2-methylisocitrate lyase-like PEP mutase family enzyme [Brevibacterium sanguinis]RBP73802.1 2-methylisocitrate lyase-like PEP mutase family enzyme [Brevibacterium celere]